jgi:exoribonuclease II
LEEYFKEILNNPQEYGNIQEEQNNIFSIDPIGCVDRDDALSICKTDIPTIYKVQIYIANIWVWIKAFDLWELFEKTNVSTIYLPDFNRHMLPSELSEKICSLNIGNPRFAFCMEFHVDVLNKTIVLYNRVNIIEQSNNEESYSSKSVVYLGGFSKEKGFNLLVEALPFLDKKVKVYFAGYYPLPSKSFLFSFNFL